MAARPSSVPTAAPAANAGPCSKARNTETGAEVRGKPASHPPTPGPHRRVTKVAMAMRSGVTMSLSQNAAEGTAPPLIRRTLARSSRGRQTPTRGGATGDGSGHERLGHLRPHADRETPQHRHQLPRAAAAQHREPES